MQHPRRAALLATAVAAALLTPGCLIMAPIVTEPPLLAPAGLAPAQVDAAIRAGINRANQNSHGSWIVEKSAPGLLVAGLTQPGDHYLQVTYTYTQARVTSRISGSRNEGQTATEINKRANYWYIRLNDFVREELTGRAPL